MNLSNTKTEPYLEDDDVQPVIMSLKCVLVYQQKALSRVIVSQTCKVRDSLDSEECGSKRHYSVNTDFFYTTQWNARIRKLPLGFEESNFGG